MAGRQQTEAVRLLGENQLALARDAQAVVETGVTNEHLAARANELFAGESLEFLRRQRLGAPIQRGGNVKVAHKGSHFPMYIHDGGADDNYSHLHRQEGCNWALI
jgi:hypothetical protein